MDDNAAEPRGRLATLLRARRTAAGLTQRQLAGRAGVSLGALEDLEQALSLLHRLGDNRAEARAPPSATGRRYGGAHG